MLGSLQNWALGFLLSKRNLAVVTSWAVGYITKKMYNDVQLMTIEQVVLSTFFNNFQSEAIKTSWQLLNENKVNLDLNEYEFQLKISRIITKLDGKGIYPTLPNRWLLEKLIEDFLVKGTAFDDQLNFDASLSNPTPNNMQTKQRTHTVQTGDTLSLISKQYGINMRTLSSLNGIKAPRYIIFPGQVLTIPV